MKRIYTRILLCALALTGIAACENGTGLETETPAPILISIVPGTGYSGCTAIISGEYFSENPEENTVTVDGTEVPVSAAARNRLTLTMPEHSLGDVEVRVSVNGKEASGALEFTYGELPEIVMSVSSVIPSYGYPGDIVTISGENFSTFPADNIVTFGGTEAEVVKATANSLEVIVPEHGRGNVEVKVTMDGQTSSVPFRYVELLVTSNQPVSGAEGVEVTISGEGFSEVPAENEVTINGVVAPVISSSLEELVVTVPDNPEGTYSFAVTVGGRTASGGEFTYSGCWRVETVLGVPSGVTGNVEGTGSDARMWYGQEIVRRSDGNYLMTFRNKDHGIYMMTSDYMFTKLVNQTDNAMLTGAYPWGCALDSEETLYIAAKGTGKLLAYTSGGVLSEYAVENLVTTGMNPMDVAIDSDDNIYLLLRGNSGTGNGSVVKIRDGAVLDRYDLTGMKLFDTMLLSHDGSKVFVFSNGNGYIRMIDLTTGENTVVAGTGTAHSNADNYTDGEAGNPLTATVRQVEGAICAEDGTVYFCDIAGGGTLREFRPGPDGNYAAGTITTIAGKAYDTSKGHQDGLSTVARFVYPNGICFAENEKTIYMIDGTANVTIRKIYYR